MLKITGGHEMRISRRTVLKGVGTLPLTAGNFGFSAFAQAPPAAPSATEVPPVLFVHGNGDHAALWITTLWRMESNGVPRDRTFAINFTDPLARTDDAVPQPNRSSTEEQRRELGEAIKELHRRAARGLGRQFARRQFDSQLYQERRGKRCQPRRAVRRPQSR